MVTKTQIKSSKLMSLANHPDTIKYESAIFQLKLATFYAKLPSSKSSSISEIIRHPAEGFQSQLIF